MTNRFVLIGLTVMLSATMLPHLSYAQTTNKTFVFDIKNLAPYIYNSNDNSETIEAVDPLIAKAAVLQDYLEQKNSPLAPYSYLLLQQENWKLVIAISNGESTMCKHQMYNNCWGVGGAWNLKRYNTFADGIVDVNDLITNKYVANGQDTPKEIVRKYVGSYSPSWVSAVSQTLNQLENLQLEI